MSKLLDFLKRLLGLVPLPRKRRTFFFNRFVLYRTGHDNNIWYFGLNKDYLDDPYKAYWSFYWGRVFKFAWSTGGYFDPRPRIVIAPGFFSMEIIMPWMSRRPAECDPPEYGIAIHGGMFWLYLGPKSEQEGSRLKAWHFPWTYKWYSTTYVFADGVFVERKKKRLEYEEKKKRQKWTSVYTHQPEGFDKPQIAMAAFHMTISEHRRRWAPWLGVSWNARRRSYIDVSFDREMGSEAGTYKGGVVGCSHRMLPDEKPMDALRRMEKERKL